MEMPVPSHENEGSSIYFASFYDFDIWFWSVVTFVFYFITEDL
jgi:hypothetical protein